VASRKRTAPDPEPAAGGPEPLKRETAGRYVSRDGRFTVEQSSGRWLAVDSTETDELGLPLVRGPWATLDEARAALTEARAAPTPISTLRERLGTRRPAKAAGSARRVKATPERKPREPEIELRSYEEGDGDALHALWRAVGFGSTGDDDRSLVAFAKRNPGLFLVATSDGEIVASALGAWDGRRGWIYHVATAEPHRRKGIAGRLVKRVEQRLRTLGCPKVNVVIRDDNPDAEPFWDALGYGAAPVRQFGKEL
jgi:GNAT superfamily N-acetyltransferase